MSVRLRYVRARNGIVFLLLVSIAVGHSEPVSYGSTAVALYLKSTPDSSHSVLASLTRELDALLNKAGFHVEWLDWRNPSVSAGAALAVMELRGSCIPPVAWLHSNRSESVSSLASTSMVEGEVVPFSWVDCAAVKRVLGPSFARLPPSRRDEAYGRAFARLLAGVY